MRGHAAAGTPRARRFPRARAGERRRLDGRFRLLPGSRGGPALNFRNFFVGGGVGWSAERIGDEHEQHVFSKSVA